MRDMFSSEASKRFKSSWQTTSEQVVTPASPFRAAIHKDNELKARDGGLIKVIMIACRQLGGAIAMEQADELVKVNVFPHKWSSQQLQEFLGTDGEGTIVVEGVDIAQNWHVEESTIRDSVLVEVFARIVSPTSSQGRIWFRLMESTAPSGRAWDWSSDPVNEEDARKLVPENIPWQISGLVRLRRHILETKEDLSLGSSPCPEEPRPTPNQQTTVVYEYVE